MIKWVSLVITVLVQLFIVVVVNFMHNASAIIAFLAVSLFVGLMLRESREDMPIRAKGILSGFTYGTYTAAVLISFLLYKRYIHI